MLIDSILRWLKRSPEPEPRVINRTIDELVRSDQELARRLHSLSVAKARYDLQRRGEQDAH